MKEETLQFFKTNLEETFLSMAEMEIKTDDFVTGSNKFDANKGPGVASIVGFSGNLKGRSLLWVPESLATEITRNVVGEEPANYRDELALFTVNELNNVISGLSTTKLNNKFQLGLRLSPPSVFAGEAFTLTTPRLKSFLLAGEYSGQNFFLDLALEGGWSE